MIEVTIGIPTYKRENSLIQLLKDLDSQTFRNFKVIVSNDDPSSSLNLNGNWCFELEYVKQKKNLGLIDNYKFLLNKCESKFFMWLADDDSLSLNYLETCIKFLKKNKDFSCCTGVWIRRSLGLDGINDQEVVLSSITSSSPLKRQLLFIEQNSDHFIYGIFRTKDLKKLKWRKYYWPNRNNVENWCFHFLFQLLSEKKFFIHENCKYIDLFQTPKNYKRLSGKFIDKVRYKLRRLNVNYFYFLDSTNKIAFLKYLLNPKRNYA